MGAAKMINNDWQALGVELFGYTIRRQQQREN